MIYFVNYRSLQSYVAKDEDICEFLDLLFRPFIDMLENRGLAFGSHFFVSTSLVSSISLVSVRLKNKEKQERICGKTIEGLCKTIEVIWRKIH